MPRAMKRKLLEFFLPKAMRLLKSTGFGVQACFPTYEQRKRCVNRLGGDSGKLRSKNASKTATFFWAVGYKC